MKKFLYIFIILLVSSCFVDKGNYSYKDINEIIIDVSSIPTEYNVTQFEKLTIAPVIKFSQNAVSEENLEYKWTIYNTNYANRFSEIIGNEKVFDKTITQQSSANSYILVLDVKDKKTGIAAQQRFTVWINSEVISGWVVVHSKDGKSDIDYIATTNAVPSLTQNRHLKNVFSLVNKTKMNGNARFIAGARRNNSVINSVYIGTDSELYKVKGKTFELELTFQNMFTIVPGTIKPQLYEIGGSYANYQFLINDGKAHAISNQSAWENTFSYALPPNVSMLNATEVDLAPFVYIPEAFPSTTKFGGVFYDKLGQRFVIMPYTTSPTATLSKFNDQINSLFNVNNIGKEIVYFEKGFNNYGYAIFKNNTSAERWLYIANFNIAMNSNLAVAMYNMTNLPEIISAKFYSTGNRGNVLLYATNKDIYTYDYSGSNTATKINNQFPANEEITCMKIYKPGTGNNLSNANGAILYVATWNGTEGKLYEFSMNEANGYLRSKEPLNVFNGFGKIMDMNHKLEGTGTGS